VKKVKSKEVKAFDLATGEEKVVGHERELELHDKIAALRMIGQHEGLFAERIELPVGTDFATALREARARAIAVAAAGRAGADRGREGREVKPPVCRLCERERWSWQAHVWPARRNGGRHRRLCQLARGLPNQSRSHP
jgi:hypothetical protein